VSTGTICLTCRKYTNGDPKWGCVCEHPIPSDDGINANKGCPACRVCGKPSPAMTVCDRCDSSSSFYGGTAIPRNWK
jgi:hypothetical protein